MLGDNGLDDNDGGDLLEGIAQFLCYVPDKTLEFLQNMFANPNKIQLLDESYSIKYSPGIIFSGEVPAFDINFISPGESKNVSKVEEQYVSLTDALEFNNAEKIYSKKYKPNINPFVTKNSCIKEIKNNASYEYDVNREINIEELEGKIQSKESDDEAFQGEIWSSEENSMVCAWESKSKTEIYIIVDSYRLEHTPVQDGGTKPEQIGEIFLYKVPSKKDLDGATDITDTNITIDTEETKEYKSTAAILQPTIATWYKALRRIALVGLLSALAYIGIRIVLTSTSAKDKAKYKNMLKDWFVALCILFALHFIMSITVTVVDRINDVIKASSIGANGEDILMSTIRNDIANGDNWGEVIVQVVMYFVLGIYTVIFTIQYFKRTIYIAFLTIIAPLITLTYPLDKIKDKKSQAFDMWIKDYIFFVLIQVVHLLLYYVLIGSSLELASKGSWVFAIVAIGFMVPAEKLVKKMFGFEKSKTMGAMAAGATGALVMNAINQISQVGAKGGKASSGGGSQGAGGSSNIRTASNNALASLRDGESSGEGAPNLGIKNAIGGATSLGGKFIKTAGGAALRGGLGATGAMLGFAAGVSQGDLKAAGAGLLAGGKAGSAVGKRLSNGVNTNAIKQGINNIKDTWNEGAFGADFAQSASEAREFKRTSAYKSLSDKYGDKLTDESLRAMLSADIKDTKTMEKVLDSGNISDAIGYYTLAKNCPESIYYDTDLLRTYITDLVEREGLAQKDADKIIKNMKMYR